MKKKYLLIVISLWLMQVACMFASIYFFIYYYDTGETPVFLLALLMLFLSIRSYSLRLDYKHSFGYLIKNAVDSNPVNQLNRRQRRAAKIRRK